MSKAIRATEIDESLEAGIGKAIHALKPSGAAFHHLENADDEVPSKNLGSLLGRVTERSTREVDNLIDELQDRDRIQGEIARHSELSRG